MALCIGHTRHWFLSPILLFDHTLLDDSSSLATEGKEYLGVAYWNQTPFDQLHAGCSSLCFFFFFLMPYSSLISPHVSLSPKFLPLFGKPLHFHKAMQHPCTMFCEFFTRINQSQPPPYLTGRPYDSSSCVLRLLYR